jgi:hypothetical protein
MASRRSISQYGLWGILGFLGALAVAASPGVSQGYSPAPAFEGAAHRAEVLENYGRLPLNFIANQGQVDRQVQFYARRGASTFFFTREGLVLTLPEAAVGRTAAADREASGPGLRPANCRAMVVRLMPLGLAPGVKLEAEEPLPGRVNYFIGNDPRRWRSDIPTCQAVVYREAYPGIDLKFYGNGQQLEYDIIVRPGAEPGRVRFRCQGVKGLEVTPAGDLALKLHGGGQLVQKKPLIYQEIGGQRQVREGQFQVQQDRGGQVYGFNLGAYDPRHPLIIDPVLLYSTFLGGTSVEFGRAIAVDGAGCAYVTGRTSSGDFPTQNPYQGNYKGVTTAFVTKLSAAGNSLVYSTYLGGSTGEHGQDIAVDGAGCAYVTGYTYSGDFPTQNPYQATKKGFSDAFVTKLSAAGNSLVYSTYLGGDNNESGYGIAVDGAGCAYVTGMTPSTDFPTQNPYQATKKGDTDAYVTKLSAAGNTLDYSTYLGGSLVEYGINIVVDGAGCAYVTGDTYSGDFPTQNPYQAVRKGTWDAFVTKLSAAGNTLDYSTYLGGDNEESGSGIVVDGAGSAYVTGWTLSANFPTQNPYQATKRGDADAFVTKLSAAGNTLDYSTYLGGNGNDYGEGIAVDGAGRAYVTGYTYSGDFPTRNPYQAAKRGDTDAFVTKLSTAGNTLYYSTYLGGDANESGHGIAVDGAGRAYVTGETYSGDFPTLNPYQAGNGGMSDAFVTKIGEPYVPPYMMLLD